MTSASQGRQQPTNYEAQSTPRSFFDRFDQGLQSYNTSGLLLDLSGQAGLELAHEERHNKDLHDDVATSQRTGSQSRRLRISTLLLLVALIATIIVTAALGGTVGSLVRKDRADSESQHTSTIDNTTEKENSILGSQQTLSVNNSTAIVSHTTAFAQQSASSTVMSSSSPSPSSLSSSSSSSTSSSSSSPSSNDYTASITLGPSETYSIISSPTLTISRDCPGSNGTTIITNDVPHQSFIKNCDWVYALHQPGGDQGNAFETVTNTLDACISLCAAYNVANGTGSRGNCTAVAWRTDLNLNSAGCCYGNFDTKAGDGEPATGGKNRPADSAFFLGWS